MTDPESWMRQALQLAAEAARLDEVPIGCIVVHDPTGTVVGSGYNRREIDHDPTAHAEIMAMRQAGQVLGHWRLLDCTLVVTLEPCPMCAGAIVNARIPRLVYGCEDPKAGAVRTLYQICEDARLNHRVQVTGGVLAEECGQVLRDFFRQKREKVADTPEIPTILTPEL
ncbi:MAG: tRNA adenosine(34) deaminase TadA [Bacillota bacterium]